MPDFQYDLDDVVQAIVEGRVTAKRQSTDRGFEYTIECRGPNGRPIYRTFFEHEVEALDEEDAPAPAVNVVPLRACA